MEESSSTVDVKGDAPEIIRRIPVPWQFKSLLKESLWLRDKDEEDYDAYKYRTSGYKAYDPDAYDPLDDDYDCEKYDTESNHSDDDFLYCSHEVLCECKGCCWRPFIGPSNQCNAGKDYDDFYLLVKRNVAGVATCVICDKTRDECKMCALCNYPCCSCDCNTETEMVQQDTA